MKDGRQASLLRVPRFLRSVWTGLLCAGALSVGCATSIELEPGEAYLLSRVGYTPGYTISGLELHNVDTGESITVKTGRATLTRATPGRYYVRRVRYAAENVYGGSRPQPASLIPIQAGKINYIGSFAIVVSGESTSRIFLDPRHDYPKDVIEEGKTLFASVFSLYPVVEARSRFEPDTSAMGTEPR